MTFIGWVQITLFAVMLLLVTKPFGLFIYDVIEGQHNYLKRILGPVESLFYKLGGVDPNKDMGWQEYSRAMLILSLVSMLFTYAVLRLQGFLPLNPMRFSTAEAPAFATSLTPDLAFNTAMSFTTNTNWQAYSGESTLSYLSQMLGLALHNWVSAAVGLAVAIVLVRGFARRSASGVKCLWYPLPNEEKTVHNSHREKYVQTGAHQIGPKVSYTYQTATTLEGASQTIPLGPVASQEWIKMLGINGGGIFNANSSHPFENPTPLSNFIQMLSIFVLPAGLTYTFGKLVSDSRQGWALYAAMFVLWFAGTLMCYHFEAAGNPLLTSQGVETSTYLLGDSGGNMEGKEVRFGLANSALFATVTTDASCGAVNGMHDSLTPLGGFVPLLNMQLGELVYGGVGAGLYGMLVYAILTVFIAGLMVGRTPEYVGKKIEKKEVKMAMLFVLAAAFSILVFTGVSSVLEFAPRAFFNPPGATWLNVNNNGPHGLSEILYAFCSGTGNNGSAFGGLTANTPYYNTLIGISMFIGRFVMMVPVLAMAGSLAAKKNVPITSGTFPTYSWQFVVLLVAVILIVGALTFFPVLALGPIVEHFLMNTGHLF